MAADLDVNRRTLLQLALGCAAPHSVTVPVMAEPAKPRFCADLLGFNLIAWDKPALGSAKHWRRAVDDIYALGARRITLVPFVLFNPEERTLIDKSRFDLVSGPKPPVLAETIRYARQRGMSVGLKPMIEMDNAAGEGEVWRGTVRLKNENVQRFFDSYSKYIVDMCRFGCREGINRFYIGTELTGIVKDPLSHPHWDTLIAACRAVIGSARCKLTYAANFDEYRNVPFWEQLDEIGIDAYFPLAAEADARGVGRPDEASIRGQFDGILARLKTFAETHRRPIMLAEWGVVPFDLTTTDPSNAVPSTTPDVEEAINAYKAMIGAMLAEADWIKGVDLWHWRVSPEEDSNYRISPGGPIAQLLRSSHSRR